MIKLCFVLLTLTTGEPTMVNFNEVLAVNRLSNFGIQESKVYFQGGTLGNSSLAAKETVEEIAEKVKKCTSNRVPDIQFVYVVE